MTAEGTACNGAAEAPKAEFAAEKVAAASPEEKAPAERDGEDVGGPFVIVNGDSDGLSDRGSDLGKAPDEDSPSEEDEAPGSNAATDAPVAGDHGEAAGEEGASGVSPGVSSADGCDHASEEPEAGADEAKGERVVDVVTVQQETAGAEPGEADAVSASGSDRAITVTESDAPAVDSEVSGKEVTEEDIAATDVSETVGQNAENAAIESCAHDEALTKTESSSAPIESEVLVVDDNREEHSTATEVEPVEQSTAESGSLMANGHSYADTKAGSSEPAAETQSYDDESKSEKSATGLVEGGDACGEQDAMDALQTNGHTDSAVSADSCIVASGSEDHANETEGQESDQQEESTPITEAEVGVLEAGDTNCAGNVESMEEDVDADDHSYVKVSADASVEPEPVIEKVEDEATCGILQVDGKMDTDGEGGTCDDSTVGVTSNEEEKPPVEEEMNEAVPGDGKLEEASEDTNQETVQGDGLVNVGETDRSVESSQEQNVHVEITTVDETAAESDLKVDTVVEGNTAAPLLSHQNCDSAVETVHDEKLEASDIVQPSEIGNDVAEAEGEKEVETEVSDAGQLQAAAASAVSTFQNEPQVIDLVDSGSIKHSSPLATELESCDHTHTEESRSQEISNSTADQFVSGTSLENESTLVGKAEQSSVGDEFQENPSDAAVDQASPLANKLESCDHESRSQEICDITVDQLVSGASLEKESTVVGEAELSSVGDEFQENPSDAVDQGESVTLNGDELVGADDAEPGLDESAGFDKVGDISKKDDQCDIDGDSKFHEDQLEIRNASTTCDGAGDISCESLNASVKSSDVVTETKCLEALEPSSVDTVVLAEDKVNSEHAHDEEANVVEDTSESHGDMDKRNMGDAQVLRQQKVYLIKVPRFAGEDLWAKIQDAHAHLDQLTQERDAINIRKHKQKLVCDQYREKLDAARREEREARAAHGDKKNDLNSVRSVIGKLNQANSIEEIEEMIATKEKIMQHETISLKEEKLLIKEINELKAQRKQLCSSMGSKAEINEAFDQKEHIHERHKTLKKDSDVLFTNLKSLEENTKKIQKSFEDERTILRKLNEEYRVANERRQKAYIHWAELKAEPFKKNKYFFMYKDDRRIAGDHMSSGDLHQLQLYCNNQVERVMEIWNSNEDFRKQYVEANKFSTLRRLGTHDGRRLGPDEDPPVIPSRRPNNSSSSLTVSSPDVPTRTSVPAPAPVLVSVKEESFPVLPSSEISKRAKSKASGTSAQNEKITVTVSERDVKETEKEKAEELEQARKAEELARMEEKLREERAAAEKERLRLEQKAKAKEAEERKRRKAEKAQERAEFKARKEAEMKEKKKAKKDKKKGPSDSRGDGDGNSTALAAADTDSNASDNSREVEVTQPTAPKRISRDAAAIKQLNRLQPMPAPLRNRGKRKMRQYILIAAAVLSVLALFVAGNYIPRMKSLHF